MGSLFSAISILSCLLFIVFLACAIALAGEVDKKYMIMLISGVILCFSSFVFCLSATEKKETVGIYNEYEYDVKALLYDLPKDKIIYTTDDSGMTYIKIEKYVFPTSHQYCITVYNYNFNEKDMSKYKYERS